MSDEEYETEPSHVFEYPERFVVGTVGQPGERAFYLQAVDSGAVVTVGLEKAEVLALAEGMVTLLESVGQSGAAPRPRAVDQAPLDTPFAEDFHVNELSVAWDGERVVIEAGDGEEGKLRVALSVPETLAFVNRAETVVAAGRPECVLCGRAAGPTGHFCPRLN
ncbi:MAG TPA: DUF3090 domain-containing protein [Frankiaceae bacterium]|nr:DUF3090 domain-containing protein [Frankiaceae bacterium]